MAEQLTAFRVFIASPGGLQAERKAFKDTLQKYNEADGLERGIYFVPVGWEATLGGYGRPQERIDKDLVRCDYFVLILWDRWGSPPQSEPEGPFTSGTEEEFQVALECLNDPVQPMKEVVVFFKALDPQPLSDPGPQLSKVLEFRKDLDSKRSLLFHTFDSIAALEDRLRQFIASWVRDYERPKQGNAHAHSTPISTSIARFHGLTSDAQPAHRSPLTASAEVLAEQGRITEAEIVFAKAVVSGEDPDALNSFGRFLRLLGRFAQAEVMLNMALNWAQERDDAYWIGTSLNGLAALYYDQGLYDKALAAAEKALSVNEGALGLEHLSVADSLDHAGEVHLARGSYRTAEPLLTRAMQIRVTHFGPDTSPVALSLNNVAGLYRAQRKHKQAEELYRKALSILNAQIRGNPREIVRALHGLGILRYSEAAYDEAEPLLKEALQITTRTLDPDHPLVARSYHDLGMLYVAQGRYSQAEPLLTSALDSAERSLGPDHPNLAYGIGGLAKLYFLQRRYPEAESLYLRAIRIREKRLRKDHPLLIPLLEGYSELLNETGRTQAFTELQTRLTDIQRAISA